MVCNLPYNSSAITLLPVRRAQNYIYFPPYIGWWWYRQSVFFFVFSLRTKQKKITSMCTHSTQHCLLSALCWVVPFFSRILFYFYYKNSFFFIYFFVKIKKHNKMLHGKKNIYFNKMVSLYVQSPHFYMVLKCV